MEQHQLINGKIFGADGTLLMAEWTRYPLGTELANLARDAQLLTLTCLASDALYQSKRIITPCYGLSLMMMST